MYACDGILFFLFWSFSLINAHTYSLSPLSSHTQAYGKVNSSGFRESQLLCGSFTFLAIFLKVRH